MEKIFDIAKDNEQSWGTLATAIDGNFNETFDEGYLDYYESPVLVTEGGYYAANGDVYKRQPLMYLKHSEMRFIKIQVILENLILLKIYTGKEKLIYPLNKLNPVSYTHLDVYKRQSQGWFL